MVKKIKDALTWDVRGKTISVLGLTLKHETDDMRKSPLLTIIPALQAKGGVIRAIDPKGMEEAKKYLKDIYYFDDPYKTAEGVDAVVIMTEWNEYGALDIIKLKTVMNGNAFIGLKGCIRLML